MAVAVAALAAATPVPAAATTATAGPVTVFAAASLTDAMTGIADAWRARTGIAVRLSFAASSTLARQIEAGAPAEVFASADAPWMDYLAERGRIDRASRTAAIGNRLVVIAPPAPGAAAPAALDLADRDAVLDRLGPDGRLALGDPAHVPAGRYARAALEALGLWDAVAPRLAPTSDVRAVLALVGRGEAPLGIVYATDARIAPAVRTVAAVPAGTHPPIVYPFALVAGASDAARAFFAHLTGPDGRAAFERLGFSRLPRDG